MRTHGFSCCRLLRVSHTASRIRCNILVLSLPLLREIVQLYLSGIVPMVFIWLLSRIPKPKVEQTHIGAEAAIQRWDDYRKQLEATTERKL